MHATFSLTRYQEEFSQQYIRQDSNDSAVFTRKRSVNASKHHDLVCTYCSSHDPSFAAVEKLTVHLAKQGRTVYHSDNSRSDWKETFFPQLRASKMAVVVLSPGYMASRRCRTELVKTFNRLADHRDVICVHADYTDTVGDFFGQTPQQINDANYVRRFLPDPIHETAALQDDWDGNLAAIASKVNERFGVRSIKQKISNGGQQHGPSDPAGPDNSAYSDGGDGETVEQEGRARGSPDQRGSKAHPDASATPAEAAASTSALGDLRLKNASAVTIDRNSKLGEGNYGIVYKGTFALSRDKQVAVAIKTLKMPDMPVEASAPLQRAVSARTKPAPRDLQRVPWVRWQRHCLVRVHDHGHAPPPAREVARVSACTICSPFCSVNTCWPFLHPLQSQRERIETERRLAKDFKVEIDALEKIQVAGGHESIVK